MSRTLDGKKAGLQDAKSLTDELKNLRKREDKMFSTLSSEISGRGARTKVRGRLLEAEERKREKERNNEITEEVKDKYAKWNKGMKQTAMIRERIQDDLKEMDKPLARRADDEDLDEHLKGIERAEDPMLNYMRKKKQQKDRKEGKTIYPTYKGPKPNPNRFGIQPGYRWDGVDRSNGFEVKLFKKRNQSKATEEYSYKWSTEDM